jgi:arginase family enzyme
VTHGTPFRRAAEEALLRDDRSMHVGLGYGGTGAPEAGGLTSRELLLILRGPAGLPLAGADVVEVAPACDHAEMTTVAASHVCYELLALMAPADG